MQKPGKPSSQHFKAARNTTGTSKPFGKVLLDLPGSLFGAAMFGFIFGCITSIAALNFLAPKAAHDLSEPPSTANFPNAPPLESLPQKQPLRIYDSTPRRDQPVAPESYGQSQPTRVESDSSDDPVPAEQPPAETTEEPPTAPPVDNIEPAVPTAPPAGLQTRESAPPAAPSPGVPVDQPPAEHPAEQ